jgi:hypothetical protein
VVRHLARAVGLDEEGTTVAVWAVLEATTYQRVGRR